MSTQTLNLTADVYQYYREHAYREPEILAQLRMTTATRFPQSYQMEISPEQGQFMHLLLKAINAQKVLEIGTFTGYSALWMALALPENGQLLTCDINGEFTTLAEQFWCQAGMDKKIELKLAPATETLAELVIKNEQKSFDFAFIDADKTVYDFYYEQCLLLVRQGGIIAIDNTLQNGRVAEPNDQAANTIALRQLNSKLLQDKRILLSMLTLSDGLTLALVL